jgi:hypothetical protein
MSKVAKASEYVEYKPKPSLSLDAKDLPELKNFKIGQTYDLDVKVKVVSLSKDDDDYLGERDEKLTRARFRVVKARECDCEG